MTSSDGRIKDKAAELADIRPVGRREKLAAPAKYDRIAFVYDYQASVTSAARAIIESTLALQSKPHTIVPARLDEFHHLDLKTYEKVRVDFASRGFRHLGDEEVLDATNAPGTIIARTVLRNFLSADGRTAAGYYQVRPRIARVLRNLLQGLANLRWIDAPRFAVTSLIPRHVFDLESELANGGFVTTSNAEPAGLLARPPTVDAVFFPLGTPLDPVLREHERRVQLRVAADPGLSVLAHSTLEDVRQMGRRLTALKQAYRASVQWVTRAELRAMSTDERLADDIFEEVQKLLRQEGPKGERNLPE